MLEAFARNLFVASILGLVRLPKEISGWKRSSRKQGALKRRKRRAPERGL
jgi:hypothetical protein